MANGAVYDENKEARFIHDRKLEMLEDLIEAANGQSVLVAYWFKQDRARILAHLAKAGYGGAMSGKDPSKVDRSGAYMARKIARDIVLSGYADKCEVQIAYAIGVAEPVSVYMETFGTEHQDRGFIEGFVRENYDMTPRGIIQDLGLLDVDYNRVSSYGHFGKKDLPWEQ